MKEYTVFFDVFGKKLKTNVKAKTPEKAALYVRETIEIVKIVEINRESKSSFDKIGDDFLEEFNELFKSIFKPKK